MKETSILELELEANSEVIALLGEYIIRGFIDIGTGIDIDTVSAGQEASSRIISFLMICNEEKRKFLK